MSADDSDAIPPSIRRAVICLWISVLLTAALTALQLFGLTANANVVVTALTGVITAALLALVAAKVTTRRGWARWLFVVLYILGSFTFIVSVLLAPKMFLSLPVLLQTSGVVQFALQTASLVLMFASTSRQWFKAPHAATSPSAL